MKNCGLFAVGVIVGIVVSDCLCREKPKPPKLPCKEDCCPKEKPKPQEKCYYQRYYK